MGINVVDYESIKSKMKLHDYFNYTKAQSDVYILGLSVQ